MSDAISKQAFMEIIKTMCRYPSSQTKAAAEIGVSKSYFNDVLHGRRDPGPTFIDGMGMEKVTSYRYTRTTKDE